MANFKTNTRYTNGEIANNTEDKEFLVVRKPLKLAKDRGDVYLTVTQDYLYRWDLLAYKAYGDYTLWWVIAEYNNIRDPLFDMKIGQTIVIPQLSRVLAAINKLGKE